MRRSSGRERRGRPVVLTIAGSDSSSGAGIQADLKTFQEIGVYGATAITAITAQNTVGVQAIESASAEIVAAQIDSVAGDLGVDGVKTGMLPSSEIVRSVADQIKRWKLDSVFVLDPVIAASTGAALGDERATAALVRELLPLAEVVTPNLAEAGAILGREIADDDDSVRAAAREIREIGPRWVVIKGGHRAGPARDLVFDGRGWHVLEADRVPAVATHGTGCTFSAAIAARIALGDDVLEAVRYAKAFVTRAIETAQRVGAGVVPVEQAGSRRVIPATGRRA